MPQEGKRPLGVSIIGGANFIFFGLIVFFLSVFSYLSLSSGSGQAIIETLQEQFPDNEITIAHIKTALVLQALISVFFCVSGFGLLKLKEWARKATLYFAFLLVLLALVTVLFNFRAISRIIIQIIYPGILILYFTNKEVEKHFKPAKPESHQA